METPPGPGRRVSYGVSDFAGGVLTRRAHVVVVFLLPSSSAGPVEAGVIGTTKFSYDLWGDTVNTASRMESHGIAGCIQVTARTYQRLRDGYQFQRRGPIPVKGKGELVTYLLLGRNR